MLNSIKRATEYGFTCNMCNWSNAGLRLVSHEGAIFEIWTHYEKELLQSCIFSPFITLVLLKFKSNKLFTSDEDNDFIVKNRSVI